MHDIPREDRHNHFNISSNVVVLPITNVRKSASGPRRPSAVPLHDRRPMAARGRPLQRRRHRRHLPRARRRRRRPQRRHRTHRLAAGRRPPIPHAPPQTQTRPQKYVAPKQSHQNAARRLHRLPLPQPAQLRHANTRLFNRGKLIYVINPEIKP